MTYGAESLKGLPDMAWVSGRMMLPRGRTGESGREDGEHTLHVAFELVGVSKESWPAGRYKGIQLVQRCGLEFCFQSHQTVKWFLPQG